MPPMPQEHEAKFKVASLAAIRRRLRAAGAAHLGTALETDEYYDTAEGRLLAADSGVRVRTFRKLAGPAGMDLRPQLTFKGPRQPGRKIKVRTERQVRLDDADAAGRILQALDLDVAMVIQKRRASYRLGRCRIELDELPLLGCFVEVEGPGARAIDRVCDLLGLTGQPILEPYTALAAEHCRKAGRSARRVTFRPAKR